MKTVITGTIHQGNFEALKQIIFGGKKNWKRFISGLIIKKEWQEIRDSEL